MSTIALKVQNVNLSFAVMFSLWLFVTSSMLLAQQGGPRDAPPPPPGLQDSPESGFPQLNVKKQLSQMTQRYDLTSAQQEAIRPILESERQQMSAFLSDNSLAPPDMFTHMNAIHKDAGKKIEAVLTDTQKAKFEKDEATMEAQRQQRMKEIREMMTPPPPGAGTPPE
jgi:hypothetical protein